jgi:membrane protease YdiL (CAAX protease family)
MTVNRRTMQEALDAIHAPVDREWQWPPIVALLVAAFCLALLNFLTHNPFAGVVSPDLLSSEEERSAYWVGCRVLCYFLLPAMTVLLSGGRLTECGLLFRGIGRSVPIYGALYLAMLPLIVAVSFTQAFQNYYPFYEYARESRGGFLLWESMYAVQFVVLEFFFRGFLLFSLARYVGVYAIFVMVIPYCMVHFGKPFAEVLAAIPAGVLLGYLALKTRSIWLGAALHIAVAWTMDVLSLVQRGALGRVVE